MSSTLRGAVVIFAFILFGARAFDGGYNATGGLSPKILDGFEANPGQFPCLIAVYQEIEFVTQVCLITKQTAIGASRPFANRIASKLHGVAGVVNRLEQGQTVYFREVILNKVGATYSTAIALLILTDEIRITRNIRPVSLPITRRNFVGKWAEVSSWGSTEIVAGNNLRYLTVFVDGSEKYPGYDPTIGKHDILINGLYFQSTEQDLGAPLIYRDRDTHVILGVLTGVTTRCQGRNNPSIFAPISYRWRFLCHFTVGDPHRQEIT